MKTKNEIISILDEVINTLEDPKGSIHSSIQKLSRVSILLGDEDLAKWCAIQLGDTKYTKPIKKLLQIVSDKKTNHTQEELDGQKEIINSLGLKYEYHLAEEELNYKNNEATGGFNGVGFIEQNYLDLVKTKRYNDGTLYSNNMLSHLDYIRRTAFQKATTIYSKLKYSETPKNSFDLIRENVDDKLLDLSPVIAEQLMQAFKSVNSNKEEQWSQALTTCRRIIEGFADTVYPPSDKTTKEGRPLGKTNFINRIWAFLDSTIESDSNKQLAKAHIDFLGSWLEKINKITNKGVHSKINQFDATKIVFHLYILFADLIKYVSNFQNSSFTLNIHSASIDELEAVLGIKRSTAKEIVKLRVSEQIITPQSLSKLKGIGEKTVKKVQELISFDPLMD